MSIFANSIPKVLQKYHNLDRIYSVHLFAIGMQNHIKHKNGQAIHLSADAYCFFLNIFPKRFLKKMRV